MKLVEVARALAAAGTNIVMGGNVVSLTLLPRPGRLMDYARQCRCLYATYADKRGLPQKNVFEVIKNGDAATRSENVTLAWQTIPHGENWFVPLASYLADLVQLCLLCRLINAKVVFEIGTLQGYTTLHFALNSTEDAQVYTLDLPPEGKDSPLLRTTITDENVMHQVRGKPKYVFDGLPASRKIHCLHGDSAAFDYSPFAGKVDLFFIDGAHSYEYVQSDTLNALKCCHPGSVIAWHDFGRFGVNGVAKWLREFSRERQVYSIPGGSLAFMVVGE
jgi:predicted O-methyltransferase YrrM